MNVDNEDLAEMRFKLHQSEIKCLTDSTDNHQRAIANLEKSVGLLATLRKEQSETIQAMEQRIATLEAALRIATATTTAQQRSISSMEERITKLETALQEHERKGLEV